MSSVGGFTMYVGELLYDYRTRIKLYFGLFQLLLKNVLSQKKHFTLLFNEHTASGPPERQYIGYD